MQNLPVVVLALLFSLFGGPVLAKKSQKSHLQKQKMEIKAWKKRKDAMAPLRLKELVEENDQLKTDNYRLMEELRSSKETVERLMELKTYLELQSDEQKVCDEARSQADSCVRLAQGTDGLGEGDWVVGKDGKSHIKGLVFKVQIGAYKKRDLSDSLGGGEESREVFEQEHLEGVNMYTLRHFRNYWQANSFKKELRAMGCKDAWVVAFKDGKRLPLKEVLQDVVVEKQ